MFTDVVGFTESAQRDEAGTLRRLREQETLVRPVLTAFGGREVKSTGDGLLVEFPSALKAVECAAEIQRRLHERNVAEPASRLEVRIGLHVGDVEGNGSDILGDAVNVAARLVPVAEPGGVCLSEAVVGQVANKLPFRFERVAPRALKGVRSEVGLYRLVLPWLRPEIPPVGGTTPRLAVLPLANISPDPKDEYFADGLTEELISVLSRLRGLRVIARTSVTPYKAHPKSIPEVGAELGVSSVLEGSVRRAGERIRITLQLIDVATQEHTWSESYDRLLTDVFAIQSEVAEQTARSIQLGLTTADVEAIRSRATSNLEAYDLYLRARSIGSLLTEGDFRRAVPLLEEAIRKDPAFGVAYAFLAHVLILASGDLVPRAEGMARARKLVGRALELEPNSSEAHSALADLATQDDHDWELARAEYERAIALNASNANAHMGYGGLLLALGELDAAEEQFRAAVEVDPASVSLRRAMVVVPLQFGDVDRAAALTRQWLADDPVPERTHLTLGLGYARLGRKEEALRELERVGPPKDDVDRLGGALLRATLGEPEEARAVLEAWEAGRIAGFVPRDVVVALYAWLGEKEKAFALLARTLDERESGLWVRYPTMLFDPLRDDPRFTEMLRRLRIPEEAIRASRFPRPPR